VFSPTIKMQGGSGSPSAVVQEAWALAKERKDETDGWQEEKKDDAATMWSKNFAANPINCFKVQGTIQAKPQQLADMMWGWRKEEWQRFAPDIDTWEIIEEVDDNTRILRQVNKLTWPLSNRDMCLAAGRITEGDTHALVFRSTINEKVPANSSNVRANVILSAFIFTPDGDNTKLTRIIHVNPEGNIPTSVVNMNAKATHAVVQTFRQLVSQL